MAFDIDALIADALEKSRNTIKYNKATLFGREWRVTTSPNLYSALGAGLGEIDALVAMLPNLVHPDEREDFRKALMAFEGMDADVMMGIINGLVEAGAEHPTKRSTASSATSKKRAAAKKSAAG